MAHEQTSIIGLIGGVGCGKSTMARWLRDHLAAEIIDADAVGHEVLLNSHVKAKLRDAFGDGIFSRDQANESNPEVDRSMVAARVFGDSPQHVAARLTLESIVHPVMRHIFLEKFAAARASDKVDLIVFDAAIILESGWQDAVDVVVFLDVPFAERSRRVATGRGWSEDELRRRESSQWPLDQKRTAADVVIDHSGTVEAAGRQLEMYLREHGHLPPAEPTASPTHELIN